MAVTGQTLFVPLIDRDHTDIRAIDEMQPLLGATERCLITKTNDLPIYPDMSAYEVPPMQYYQTLRLTTNGVTVTNTVTNALTWHLASRGMLTSNDHFIRQAAPYYVNTNTVSNLSPQFVNWTFTGLCANAGVNAFTNDWPYQVTYTDYVSRLKVLSKMESIQRPSVYANTEEWTGYGAYTSIVEDDGTGFTHAYDAAALAYSFKTSGAFSTLFVQDTFLSKEVFTNITGSNIYQTNLIIITTNNVVVTGTNIYFENFGGSLIVTNYVASGGEPDMSGVYYQIPGEWSPEFYGFENSGVISSWGPYSFFMLMDIASYALWTNDSFLSAFGTYYPANEYASGIVTVDQHSVEDLWPDLPSGVYTNNGSDQWWHGAYADIHADYIGYAVYLAADSSDYPDSLRTFFYISTTEFGTETWGIYDSWFDAAWMESGAATARWDYVTEPNPVDPSGTYLPVADFEDKPAWTNAPWCVVYSNGYYYITTNTGALSPAWKKETENAGADSPGLTYSNTVGDGVAGTATATYSYLWTNIYTLSWVYSANLTKHAVTNRAFVYSNDFEQAIFVDGMNEFDMNAMGRRIRGLYVKPGVRGGGTFYDQGFTLSNGVWNLVGEGSSEVGSNDFVSMPFGQDNISTPPPQGITNDGYYGFMIQDQPVFILDWGFRYSTNFNCGGGL